MFSTAVRTLPRNIPASVAVQRITGRQQAVLAAGSVGIWAGVLAGAPYWAPRAGDRATRIFDRLGEKVEKMPRLRRALAGVRITIPRIGSVG